MSGQYPGSFETGQSGSSSGISTGPPMSGQTGFTSGHGPPGPSPFGVPIQAGRPGMGPPLPNMNTHPNQMYNGYNDGQGDIMRSGPPAPGMMGPPSGISHSHQQSSPPTSQFQNLSVSAPLGGYPVSQGPGSPMPPHSSTGIAPQTGGMGHPSASSKTPRPHPAGMGQPPHSVAPPPTRMGQPPYSMAPPQTGMGQPPYSMAPPQTGMGQPPHSMAPPQTGMGQPPYSVAPPQTGMRQSSHSMAPPQTGMGQPPHGMASSQPGMGQPPNSGAAPHGGMGQPPFSMTQPYAGMGGQLPHSGVPPPGGVGQTSHSMVPPQAGTGQPPINAGPQQTGMGHPPRPPFGGGTGHPSSDPGVPHGGLGALPQRGIAPPPRTAHPAVGGSSGQPLGQPPSSIGGQGQNLGTQAMAGLPPSSMGQPQPFPGPTVPGGLVFQPSAGFGQPPGAGSGPPAGPSLMAPSSNQYAKYQQPAAPGMMPPVVPGGQEGAGRGQPRLSMQPPAPQPQQPRRLDPDQMPSPIQVIEDDKRNRSGPFQANQKGVTPPLVTTKFTTQDQGYANPRFLRSTMYNIPCNSDMLKASHIPFALSVTPFSKLGSQEPPPPIVDLGELGPVRCKRCKAYMSPYMVFLDGGRRFQCVFCNATTDVPSEYFAHLDHTGRRTDCYQRAELCLGTYEFVATKDYCKDNEFPKQPAFIFMIDVSYNSVKSGLVNLICERLKDDILVNLPKEADMEESEIRIGFVTYHKELHFYNVKSSLAQPQMMVVSDLEDMFVPLVDGFLVTLAESEAVIDSLLAQIPQLFADSKEPETVLGPVIQAGLDALRSAERCGRLYIFHTSLPTIEAPGKLKNRDDRKLLGTDKEKSLLNPQIPFYQKLGQECVAVGCSVNLFLFPNSYCDLASIVDAVRLTGGNVHKYSFFQADVDGDRFMEDLQRNVENTAGFDGILRIRTSTGIRPVEFYGNFYMSNSTDVELAGMDTDQSIAVEIKHDDKLSEAEGAFVQVAVLYTSVSGQRRLRIINQGFNCCTQMADLFRSCELDTLVNFFAKQAIRNTLNHNPKYVREHLMNEVAQILACYRKNCANPSSAGQLILPEGMKLLPLYANCVIKSDGIQGGSEILTDDRSYLMHLINAMDVCTSNVFFYPKLLPVHTADFDSHDLPTAIRCSTERLQDNGVYLMENGVSMYLWIGHTVDPELIQQLFGVASAAQVDIDKGHLMELDNPASQKLRDMIDSIRQERTRFLKLTIVRQRDALEQWFNHFLVEDKGMNGSSSYVDFLCHIHREIRNILD